jgi:nucleoside-diphosphate-sugar epimerase
VLHLGARATFEFYNTLKPVILDGSLALIKAAIEVGVKSFVCSSSILLYGDNSGEVDGATPANPLLD